MPPYSHSGDAEPSQQPQAHPLLAALQVELDARDRVIQGQKDALTKTKEELAGYTELFDGIKPDTYHTTLSSEPDAYQPGVFGGYYESRMRLDVSFEVSESATAYKWLDAIKQAGK